MMMTEDVDFNAEIDRLKKELAAADRFGEDMYRKVQTLEALMRHTNTCASCGATVMNRESYP